MITALKIISFAGLGLTIFPSILVLMGKMDLEMNKNLMVSGMILWFVGAYFWIYRKKKSVN
ncbi:MAG TPA: hypothetical protein VI583_16460 [Cyclobacteriaceae bacterium]|nr:hypothetical protein [Cyclobacteriaceae bacterium]